MNIYEQIENEVKSNYKKYNINKEDEWHDIAGKKTTAQVVRAIREYTNKDSIILNVGSGGATYKCDCKMIHLDIVEDNIKQFKDYIVASVTDIPLQRNSVDMIICVGSVLNYTNAEKTIPELKRVLKPNGVLVLEFERTDSSDFLFQKRHHKDYFETSYVYDGIKQKMIMYGEKYIKKLVSNNKMTIIKTKRYHIASTLALKLNFKELTACKLAKVDWLLYPLSYELAHNVIMLIKNNK